MFRTSLQLTVMAIGMLLSAVGQSTAVEDPKPAEDIRPLTPMSQTKIDEFRSRGSSSPFALSPDGKLLVTGDSQHLTVYNLVSQPRLPIGPPRQPRQINVGQSYFSNSQIAFSADGKTVIGAPSDNIGGQAVRFWDLASGKEIRQIDNDQQCQGLAISPDGKMLAFGTYQRLELWDAKTGEEIRVIQGADNTVFRLLAFSPDGKTLASAGMGKQLRLWEVATGKERRQFNLDIDSSLKGQRFRFRDHNDGQVLITSLAFSRDGKILAAGCNDGTIHLFDLGTGEELLPLIGHKGSVGSLTFTLDGKNLVSFDNQALKLVWSTQKLGWFPTSLPALSDNEFEKLWTDLAEGDSFLRYRAMRYLSADPKRTLPFLEKRLRPVPAGDSEKINQLINDLQNQNSGLRRKAMTELQKHGEAALAPIYKVVNEGRNNQAMVIVLNKLETQLSSVDRSASIKSVRILEKIGNDEARKILEKLGKGAEGARLTVEAKAAVERLTKRNGEGTNKD